MEMCVLLQIKNTAAAPGWFPTPDHVPAYQENKSLSKWNKIVLIYVLTLNVNFRFVQCTRKWKVLKT